MVSSCSNADEKSNQDEKKYENFCGTSSLPENKIWNIDCSGRIIFDQNCASCHAKSDKDMTGPSVVYSPFSLDSALYSQLLFFDPNEKLSHSTDYLEIQERFKQGYHLKHKFNLADSSKNQLKIFLDSINIVYQYYYLD